MYIDVSVTASRNRYGGGTSDKFALDVPDEFLTQVQDKLVPALSELIATVINKQMTKRSVEEEA